MIMDTNTTNIRIGSWLFRWRSYLPLIFLIILLPGFINYSYPKGSHVYDLIWEIFCLSISLFGFLIRCYTIGYVPSGTSGRDEKSKKAEALNTDGIYSVMRNPLYVGNFFMYFGVTMFPRLWWISLIYALVFLIYYERIILSEEIFLRDKFGKAFEDYTDRTPAFFPKFKCWQPPKLSFSFRNVLRREYPGFFGLIVSFNVFEIISDLIVHDRFVVDPIWGGLFILGLILYFTLRTLKKKTKVLHVEGR